MFKLLHLSALAIFAYANMVVNGDFEDFADAYCKKGWCLSSNISAIAPWKLAIGPKFELDGTVWPAQSGKWSMDLSADEPYSITQDIPTVSGKRYNLTFYLNKNQACADADRTGYYQIGRESKISFIHAKGLKKWVKIQKSFIASSNCSLTIGSTSEGSCGPVLDNVSVVKVDADIPKPTFETIIENSSNQLWIIISLSALSLFIIILLLLFYRKIPKVSFQSNDHESFRGSENTI
jgi:hypothetical protein